MKIFAHKGELQIPAGGISTVETVTIGGITQKILIQAEQPGNPVLLILHGGPAMPVPGAGCRGRDYVIATTMKELIKHFTVVFWDQRGTGGSYHANIPRDSIHVDQYVSDATEVVNLLRKRYGQSKIFLAAHSWGTVLGLRLASEQPEKFHAYVGLSQLINWAENDRLCREWVLQKAREAGNQKAIQELERVGLPPYTESFKQWGVLRKWLMKYNSMIYTDETIRHPGTKGAFSILLRSPDYSLRDLVGMFARGFAMSYSQRMIEDFARIDFIKSAPRISVPLFFIHGRHDRHVRSDLLEQYVAHVEAPNGKQIRWAERSSHLFHPDDAREIETFLIQEVRKLADTPA